MPGILKLLNFLKFLNLQVGRLAPGAQHRGRHLRDWIWAFFKIAPMANCLIEFKSSKIGMLMKGSLQRSSVQPTMALSESISNVNLSFCTPFNIFIWVLVRVGVLMECDQQHRPAKKSGFRKLGISMDIYNSIYTM